MFQFLTPHHRKTLGTILILPVLFSTTACATLHQIHPGALNPTDSAAYDALLIAGATIDQARLALQAGNLPESIRPALNTLIRSYNVARESWLSYRGAIGTNIPIQPYFDQLNKNLADLSAALKQFEEDQ
jgi:hypothetical protein